MISSEWRLLLASESRAEVVRLPRTRSATPIDGTTILKNSSGYSKSVCGPDVRWSRRPASVRHCGPGFSITKNTDTPDDVLCLEWPVVRNQQVVGSSRTAGSRISG